jgi:hypothetical protein
MLKEARLYSVAYNVCWVKVDAIHLPQPYIVYSEKGPYSNTLISIIKIITFPALKQFSLLRKQIKISLERVFTF